MQIPHVRPDGVIKVKKVRVCPNVSFNPFLYLLLLHPFNIWIHLKKVVRSSDVVGGSLNGLAVIKMVVILKISNLPHVQVAVSGSQLSRFLGSPGHSYSPMVGVDGAG